MIENIEILNFEITNSQTTDQMFSILKKTTGLKRLDVRIETNELVHFPKGSIPITVERLMIGVAKHSKKLNFMNYRFQGVLEIGSIPGSVTMLCLHHRMIIHDPHNLVPSSVGYIWFFDWNNVIPGRIPYGVKKLLLGEVEKPKEPIGLGVLPPNLTELDISCSHCKLEAGVFPNSITVLNLNFYKFPLEDGILPKSLLHLKMGLSNQQENDVFPTGLKTLCLQYTYGNKVPSGLPISLTDLSISTSIFNTNPDMFPPFLERLALNFYSNFILPQNLKILILRCQFIDEFENFPDKLEEIDFYGQIVCWRWFDIVTELYSKAISSIRFSNVDGTLIRQYLQSLREEVGESNYQSFLKKLTSHVSTLFIDQKEKSISIGTLVEILKYLPQDSLDSLVYKIEIGDTIIEESGGEDKNQQSRELISDQLQFLLKTSSKILEVAVTSNLQSFYYESPELETNGDLDEPYLDYFQLDWCNRHTSLFTSVTSIHFINEPTDNDWECMARLFVNAEEFDFVEITNETFSNFKMFPKLKRLIFRHLLFSVLDDKDWFHFSKIRSLELQEIGFTLHHPPLDQPYGIKNLTNLESLSISLTQDENILTWFNSLITTNSNTLTSLNLDSIISQPTSAPGTPFLVKKTNEQEISILEKLDKRYFELGFDINSDILNKISCDSKIEEIDQLCVEIDGYLEVVDSRFNDLIKKSYNGFVEGMSQVYEIERDLTHSAVLCGSGKQYLGSVQKDLTVFGFTLLAKYRVRQIYKYTLSQITRIKDISETSRRIQQFLNCNEFSEALLLSQKIKDLSSFSHYNYVSNLIEGHQSTVHLILDKIDTAFIEVCHQYKAKQLEKIMESYYLLNQGIRLREKIHQNFILNVEEHSRKIVKTQIQMSYSNPEELKSMRFVDMCKLLNEEQFVPTLLAILEHLSSLMWSHYMMKNWILLKSQEKIVEEEKKFYIDIFKLLYTNRKSMWNTIQSQVKHILGSLKTTLKIEEFIKVLDSINHFVDFGHEFSGEDANILKSMMKDKSFAYFENFHRKLIEDLKIYLENEMWHKVPLPNDFTVLDIKEFGAVILTPNTTRKLSSSKPPPPLLLLSLTEEKQISLNPDDHNIPFLNNFKSDGKSNPFSSMIESRKTLSEAAGDRLDHLNKDNNKNNNNTNGNSGGTQNLSSPMICATTVYVIKLIGKYLQMMKILKPLAYSIFTAIAQLLEYYVYTVFTFFGGDTSNHSIFNDDSNINPILKKTMQRLRSKFNSSSSSSTPTLQSSSLLSSTHLFQSKLNSPLSLRSSSDGNSKPPPLNIQNKDHQNISKSESDAEISIQWTLPKLSEQVLLDKNLYGLEYKITGLESMMFLVDAIMEAQPLVLSLVPGEKVDSISNFYLETVRVVVLLRNLCYKNIASQLLNFDQIYGLISSTKWDLKEVPIQHNQYVSKIIIEFHRFTGNLNEISSKSSLSQKVRNLLWENTITFAMETLIDAYSKIKKCTNFGRNLMTMDVKKLQSDLESLTTIRPIPHIKHVEDYITAFYLRDTDLLKLAKDSEFTVKQIISVVNVIPVEFLPKNTKQKLLNDLEDLEKQRKLEK
eukprot:gene2772-3446_t